MDTAIELPDAPAVSGAPFVPSAPDAISARHAATRCRPPEPRPSVRLSDAALEFEHLLVTAHRHGVVELSEIRHALGAVVHVIAAAIRQRSTTTAVVASPGAATNVEPVGSVLLDRAAARFSTRVIGTEIGRRPCPPSVLAALDHARRTLLTVGGPDRGKITAWT